MDFTWDCFSSYVIVNSKQGILKFLMSCYNVSTKRKPTLQGPFMVALLDCDHGSSLEFNRFLMESPSNQAPGNGTTLPRIRPSQKESSFPATIF